MAEHVVSEARLLTSFTRILMFCTYLTVQVAFFDLGPFNTVAALVIAVFKATPGRALLHARAMTARADLAGRRRAASSGWASCWP